MEFFVEMIRYSSHDLKIVDAAWHCNEVGMNLGRHITAIKYHVGIEGDNNDSRFNFSIKLLAMQTA